MFHQVTQLQFDAEYSGNISLFALGQSTVSVAQGTVARLVVTVEVNIFSCNQTESKHNQE